MGETDSRSSFSKFTQLVTGRATLQCRWKAHFSGIKSVHHQHHCCHHFYYTSISLVKNSIYYTIVLSEWPVSRSRSSIYAEESARDVGLLVRFQAVPFGGFVGGPMGEILRRIQHDQQGGTVFSFYALTSGHHHRPFLSSCLALFQDLYGRQKGGSQDQF